MGGSRKSGGGSGKSVRSTGQVAEPKTRLKTSKEVFDMICSDPQFDAAMCDVVYVDRVVGRRVRCPASSWVPISKDGDVPWHRVWSFEYSGTVFWERESRFFDMQLLRSLAAGELINTYRQHIPAATKGACQLPKNFKLATLNILFDLYEYRTTKLELRLPRISTHLMQLNADIILLQECTLKVLTFFKDQAWVKSYHILHTDLDPYGQITLSRVAPLHTSQHHLSQVKRALKTSFCVELSGRDTQDSCTAVQDSCTYVQESCTSESCTPEFDDDISLVKAKVVSVASPVDTASSSSAPSHDNSCDAAIQAQKPIQHESEPMAGLQLPAGSLPSKQAQTIVIDVWNVHLPNVVFGGAAAQFEEECKRAGLGSGEQPLDPRAAQLQDLENLARNTAAEAVVVAGDFNAFGVDNMGPFTEESVTDAPRKITRVSSDAAVPAVGVPDAAASARDKPNVAISAGHNSNAAVSAGVNPVGAVSTGVSSKVAALSGVINAVSSAAVKDDAGFAGVGSTALGAYMTGMVGAPQHAGQRARAWRDAWVHCKGSEDPGLTYDPDNNTLASWNSRTGLRARLDRILLRGAWLEVDDMTLFGDDRQKPLSDHYGLLAQLRAVHAPPVPRGLLQALPALEANVPGTSQGLKIPIQDLSGTVDGPVTESLPSLSEAAASTSFAPPSSATDSEPPATVALLPTNAPKFATSVPRQVGGVSEGTQLTGPVVSGSRSVRSSNGEADVVGAVAVIQQDPTSDVDHSDALPQRQRRARGARLHGAQNQFTDTDIILGNQEPWHAAKNHSITSGLNQKVAHSNEGATIQVSHPGVAGQAIPIGNEAAQLLQNAALVTQKQSNRRAQPKKQAVCAGVTGGAGDDVLVALAWVVNPSDWPAINVVRKKYDPRFVQWMPHVTIIPPSLPKRLLPHVMNLVQLDPKLEPFSFCCCENCKCCDAENAGAMGTRQATSLTESRQQLEMLPGSVTIDAVASAAADSTSEDDSVVTTDDVLDASTNDVTHSVDPDRITDDVPQAANVAHRIKDDVAHSSSDDVSLVDTNYIANNLTQSSSVYTSHRCAADVQGAEVASHSGANGIASHSQVDHFFHNYNVTVVLVPCPASAGRFSRLHSSVLAAVREFQTGRAAGRDAAEAFRPHLTVGKASKPNLSTLPELFELTELAARLADELPLHKWKVERLCAISRGSGPHKVVQRIINLPTAPPVDVVCILAALRQSFPGMLFEPVGSHRLGVATPSSDIDLLALGVLPKDEAVQQLQVFLETCGLFYGTYVVENKFMRYLRCWTADHVVVDLQYVQWVQQEQQATGNSQLAVHPEQLSLVELIARMQQPAMRADATQIAMLAEPHKLLEYVGPDQVQRYKACLRRAKAWAQQVGVYNASCGYWGGLAWAIATAIAIVLNPNTTADPKSQPTHVAAPQAAEVAAGVPACTEVESETKYRVMHARQGSEAVEAVHCALRDNEAAGSQVDATDDVHEEDAVNQDLDFLLSFLATWDWSQPLSIATAGCVAKAVEGSKPPSWPELGRSALAGLPRPTLRVLTSTLAGTPSARLVVPSTAAVMLAAFKAGREQAVAAVGKIRKGLRYQLELRLQSEDWEGVGMAAIRLNKHVAKLVIDMDNNCGGVLPADKWTMVEADGRGSSNHQLSWVISFKENVPAAQTAACNLCKESCLSDIAVSLTHNVTSSTGG